MKYCTNCGNELDDDAYVCPKCGVLADKNFQLTGNGTQKADSFYWLPFVLGCIALLVILSDVLSRLTNYWRIYDRLCGFSVCGFLAVVSSIKYLKTEKKVFPILGLVFGCICCAFMLYEIIVETAFLFIYYI